MTQNKTKVKLVYKPRTKTIFKPQQWCTKLKLRDNALEGMTTYYNEWMPENFQGGIFRVKSVNRNTCLTGRI